MELAYHHVVPDIELPPLVEQRLLYVFLHDVGLLCPVEVLLLLLQNRVQLIDLINDRNPLPAIGKLSWLHDPHILYHLLC